MNNIAEYHTAKHQWLVHKDPGAKDIMNKAKKNADRNINEAFKILKACARS